MRERERERERERWREMEVRGERDITLLADELQGRCIEF